MICFDDLFMDVLSAHSSIDIADGQLIDPEKGLWNCGIVEFWSLTWPDK